MQDDSQNPKTVSMWITSLAISVTCCAVLFVIFAGYLTDIEKNIAIGNMQLEDITLQQTKLLAEIQNLHRALNPLPPAAPAPADGATVTPPAPTATPPAVVTTPPAPTPATTDKLSPTAPVTPPPVAPTAIPEVPAKP